MGSQGGDQGTDGMISRDWMCQNSACGSVFHSYSDANPPCPECGCLRVSWVPGGGHVLSGRTRSLDRTVRGLAEQHGMTNLNSPSESRLNRAAPRVYQPPLSPELGVKHWGHGIATQFSAHGVTATQAASPINLTGKLAVGQHAQPRYGGGSVPGPMANTVIEGRDKRRIPT